MKIIYKIVLYFLTFFKQFEILFRRASFLSLLLFLPLSLHAGTKEVFISDATVTEGNSGQVSMVFTLTMTDNPAGGEVISYSTSDGTATVADNDYVATTGSITLAAGQKTATISIPVNGDTWVEAAETFNVNISITVDSTNVKNIGDGTGVGTISNDDVTNHPIASISPSTVTIAEGTASLNLTVNLDVAPNTDPVLVVYASSYPGMSGYIEIAKGQTNGTITLVTGSVPGSTAFDVALTNVIGTYNQGSGTVSSNNVSHITVKGPNTPPVANDDTYTTPYQTQLSGNLLTDGTPDSDADGDPLSITGTNKTGLAGTVTVNSNGTFIFMPESGFSGTTSFTYTLSDGYGGTDTGTVTITVSEFVNTPPVANDKNYTTPIDTQITGNVITGQGAISGVADSDIDNDTLSVTTTSVGAFSIQSDGSFTYTPSGGEDINFTYQYTITDGHGGEANATITIFVGGGFPPDVVVKKVSSQSQVIINSDFYYLVTVTNQGAGDASSVSIIDSLPSGLTYLSVEETNWSCGQSSGTVVCSLDNNLSSGMSATVKINVRAPSSEMNLTNTATVEADNDSNTSNNIDTASTIIVDSLPTAYNAVQLCYRDITTTTTGCTKVGNFYYGEGCTAKVEVKVESNTTGGITDLNITKMYAIDASKNNPATLDLTSGSCISNLGTCYGPKTISVADYQTYLSGYNVYNNILGLEANATVTMIDTGTKTSHSNELVDQIAVFATYIHNGYYHYGRVLECTGLSEGGIEITSAADVIDTYIPYNDMTLRGYYDNSTNTSDQNNNLKFIRTMASNSLRVMVGVHLDQQTRKTKIYEAPRDADGNLIEGIGGSYDSPYAIMPYLVDDQDGDCGGTGQPLLNQNGEQLVIYVHDGNVSATGTLRVPKNIKQNARMQLIIVDPNLLSAEGQDCLANSSTTGNLAGIGQCANSATQYVPGFGVDAYDRCGHGNGDPCNSSHGGWSCGPSVHEATADCPDYNSLYDHPLGCFMCTFNAKNSCSTDNFAIRPDRLMGNFNAFPNDEPNLMRAGMTYNVPLEGWHADVNVTTPATDRLVQGYTVDNFHMILGTPDPVKFFRDGMEDNESRLHGVATVDKTTPIDMKDGITYLHGSTTPGGVGIKYSDIGRVTIYISDNTWSAVDSDDTNAGCKGNFHMDICGEFNLTFIPHHFKFADLNLTNNGGPDTNFTYIADRRGIDDSDPLATSRSLMAARVHARVQAMSRDGNVTQNFRADDGIYLYYENPVEINQTINLQGRDSTSNEIVISGVDPNAYFYGNEIDNPATSPEQNVYETNITTRLLGFGPEGAYATDVPGERTIPWNETNTSTELKFNYRREIDVPRNPFEVNGSYYSIAISSHYDGNNSFGVATVADINGTRVGDYNTSALLTCATDEGCEHNNSKGRVVFYYGRAKPNKELYDDITVDTANTPVTAVVYCDLGFVQCARYIPFVVNAQTNEANWWLSMGHNAAIGDGNITLIENNTTTDPAGNVHDVTHNVSLVDGIDENVWDSTPAGGDRPLIVEIDLVRKSDPSTPAIYTNEWLIFNPQGPIITEPFFKVRYIGTGGWSGVGETGNALDTGAETTKMKRLNW